MFEVILNRTRMKLYKPIGQSHITSKNKFCLQGMQIYF